MSDIVSTGATSCKMYYISNDEDVREGIGYLECSSSVAEVQTAMNTTPSSNIITVNIYPNNNPARTPIATSIPAENIISLRSAPSSSWLQYKDKGSYRLVLVSESTDDFRSMVALSAPTGLSVEAGDDGVVLTWTDNASGEEGYEIWASDDGGVFALLSTSLSSTYTDTRTDEDITTSIYKVMSLS